MVGGEKELITDAPWGRFETVFPTVLRVQKHWPECVFEGVANQYPDVIIYKNQKAKDYWHDDFPLEVTDTDRISFQFTDHKLKMTYEPDTEAASIVKELALEYMKLDIMRKSWRGIGIKVNDDGSDTETA